MIRYTVHFSGHVQGVGFRYQCVSAAEKYDVAGYVRNLPDGRVELAAEGAEESLAALVGDVLQAMRGYVEKHTIEKSQATGEFGEPGVAGVSVRR